MPAKDGAPCKLGCIDRLPPYVLLRVLERSGDGGREHRGGHGHESEGQHVQHHEQVR